ncbi:M56 family metallopeptidase [Mucilaginibacter lacusdianchii]|uniref:M56 family metallopeptidase n=1 Tax=Mucilaginibacter lacusdianchii TaxID=2684211 RepID=UPI00131E1B4A|nr:M56 family metallopeptidase [Mucilaginibacter sp. JXJ CY 39]
MPALLLYLFKVNVALLLFCLGYYTVLRRLTFYTINRIYLILAIAFSAIYPTINLSNVVEQHQHIVQPFQVVIINFNSKATQLVQPIAQTNYWQWIVGIFWFGVGVMILRLLVQMASLYKLYLRSIPASLLHHPVRIIPEPTNPFSFWQSIYINPSQHSVKELPAIIAHEQVHVKQWHTLDILLAELALIFYWFNPGMWLIKKAVSENLEFITDRQILRQGADAKNYQYSLLYTSFNTSPNAIVNHFNISTIKKRIMMMNAKRSSPFNLTRYGMIIPVIVILLLAFSTSKASLIKEGIATVKSTTQQVLNATQLSAANQSSTSSHADNSLKSLLLIEKTNHIEKDTVPQSSKSLKINVTGKDTTYYLLNGNPIAAANLDKIDPNTIASLTVIKAPSAAKLFSGAGSQGAVLIVTKDAANNSSVLDLLTRIDKIKGNEDGRHIATLTVEPRDGSLNSISIVGKPDSLLSRLNGNIKSITINRNGSSNATTDSSKLAEFNVTGKSANSATNTITIRQTDKRSKVAPVVVLDGVVYQDYDLNSIDANTIENIEVIKDASNTEFLKKYGPKAINGIIKITTKQEKPVKKDKQ